MPRLSTFKSTRLKRRTASPHGNPDDLDPKRWIFDRAFPEQYGSTVRQRLRNRLLLADFTNIKLRRNSRQDTAWTVKMNRGNHREISDQDQLIRCLVGLASDLGRTIERAGITTAITGEQIEASFIMLAST